MTTNDGSGARRVRRLGRSGHLVECAGLADAIAVREALLSNESPVVDRIADCVLGAQTVVVRGVGLSADEIRAAISVAGPGHASDIAGNAGSREVTIDVEYSGEDLSDLAAYLGMSSAALIELHSSTIWVAAFGGFAPGFFYCLPAADAGVSDDAPSGTPPSGPGFPNSEPFPEVPRLAEPRSVVPTGSVALAGRYSAVYPQSSPGGWRLIGRTAASLFEPERQPPALLAPGDRIRYRPTRSVAPEVRGAHLERGSSQALHSGSDEPPATERNRSLLVRTTGPLVLIQDRGRPGFADIGVPRSGAADRAAAAAGNELVGNAMGAALLEVLFGGLAVTAEGAQVIALTGAPVDATVTRPDGVIDYAPPFGQPFALPAGCTLRLGTPEAGLRTYVAVRGGFEARETLGSRSTDTLTGIGPDPLSPGDVLRVGPAPSSATGNPTVLEPPASGLFDPHSTLTLRVVPGPRDEWIDSESVARFLSAEWTIGEQSDRVGVRLQGDQLIRSTDQELPSEGVVPGSVQITGAGFPVVFLRDHPVTGGYPVIACVVEADLDLLAQARPGRTVRFRAVD